MALRSWSSLPPTPGRYPKRLDILDIQVSRDILDILANQTILDILDIPDTWISWIL